MTRRRNLEHHRHSLAEIRNIMNSMKTLAYMETRKLTRFLDAQHAVVESIEEVAADFLGFYPETLPESKDARPVYLLIGTERGFCGDFNHALLKRLQSALPAHPSGSVMLIAVGRKLHALLEDNSYDANVAALIDGASVAEEVTELLGRVVTELAALQDKQGVLSVFCLHHGSDDGILIQKLLPPFEELLNEPPRFAFPPVMNQAPREFLLELTDQHLFAALHEMVYASLMAENRQRMAHLEGAVQHLDDESTELARKINALRQEEIIEEIEVILLSATRPEKKTERRAHVGMTGNNNDKQ
ncbi:MAG: FoF1 ATP synthase subunit gamma [Gammaproteobacteria bacterium]